MKYGVLRCWQTICRETSTNGSHSVILRVMFFAVLTFDLYSHPLCFVPSEKISPRSAETGERRLAQKSWSKCYAAELTLREGTLRERFHTGIMKNYWGHDIIKCMSWKCRINWIEVRQTWTNCISVSPYYSWIKYSRAVLEVAFLSWNNSMTVLFHHLPRHMYNYMKSHQRTECSLFFRE